MITIEKDPAVKGFVVRAAEDGRKVKKAHLARIVAVVIWPEATKPGYVLVAGEGHKPGREWYLLREYHEDLGYTATARALAGLRERWMVDQVYFEAGTMAFLQQFYLICEHERITVPEMAAAPDEDLAFSLPFVAEALKSGKDRPLGKMERLGEDLERLKVAEEIALEELKAGRLPALKALCLLGSVFSLMPIEEPVELAKHEPSDAWTGI